MNSINVYIPWRDIGCEYRKKHFLFLQKYYSEIGRVIPVDSNYEIFNRSNARNNCVDLEKSNILVIVDADNFITHRQIISAVNIAKEKNRFVRPFNSIHYLNKNATERFYKDYRNFYPNNEDYEYMTPSSITIENSGGAYVVIKSIWNELGGMDENFMHWGAEDLAFNHKYSFYYGDQYIVNGRNYNLHHPAERILPDENWNRYVSEYREKFKRREVD